MNHTTILEDHRIPPEFRLLKPSVARLFLAGELPRAPIVAIVGTRTPTGDAARFAHRIAGDFAREGVAIASGGALGIDAAAHRGAMDALGTTIVVSPSSLDHPYPEAHASLFAEVVETGGTVLSEHAEGVAPMRHRFFRRNQLLVALSQAVVIVEAPFQSGARNAALWARRLGKPVFVVPSPPWNPRGGGCIAELKLGGRAFFNHRDVLSVLSLRPAILPMPVAAFSGETPKRSVARREPRKAVPAAPAPPTGVPTVAEQRVLDALGSEPRHLDAIATGSETPVRELAALVMGLELRGWVVRCAGGLYRRA